MIDVEDLSKHYRVAGGSWLRAKSKVVKAVDGVTFKIAAGEALGLVGESGSGKSTIGQMILMQTAPTSGRISFEGTDLAKLGSGAAQVLKGKAQVVFQDPYDALNPRMRVRDIIAEPLRNLHQHTRQQIEQLVNAVIQRVGLQIHDLEKYPHQFSGGQRQRIGIARAVSVNPRFIVLDEPVSALDVSVQAQVINLLMDLRQAQNIAYLFISHNLAIVEHVCERVAILYLGKIVEILPTEALHRVKLHPYTRALFDAIPIPDPARIQVTSPLPGDIPDPANLPAGCRFSSRCPMAQDLCRTLEPDLIELAPGHSMACHRHAELSPVLS